MSKHLKIINRCGKPITVKYRDFSRRIVNNRSFSIDSTIFGDMDTVEVVRHKVNKVIDDKKCVVIQNKGRKQFVIKDGTSKNVIKFGQSFAVHSNGSLDQLVLIEQTAENLRQVVDYNTPQYFVPTINPNYLIKFNSIQFPNNDNIQLINLGTRIYFYLSSTIQVRPSLTFGRFNLQTGVISANVTMNVYDVNNRLTNSIVRDYTPFGLPTTKVFEIPNDITGGYSLEFKSDQFILFDNVPTAYSAEIVIVKRVTVYSMFIPLASFEQVAPGVYNFPMNLVMMTPAEIKPVSIILGQAAISLNLNTNNYLFIVTRLTQSPVTSPQPPFNFTLQRNGDNFNGTSETVSSTVGPGTLNVKFSIVTEQSNILLENCLLTFTFTETV